MNLKISFAAIKKETAAFCLEEEYSRGIFYARNRFLVDSSALLICFYGGKPGGTKYTVDYAALKGLDIINLAKEAKSIGSL